MAKVKSKTQGSRPRSRTQKIQDLGYTFQGQILSRPRTGLLAAKAKDTARKCFPKKGLRSKCSQVFRKLQATQKNKKKGFRPQIHKFSTKFVRQKIFWKFSCVLQDETTLLMTLAHFQQVKK